ncbi:hypothetical protein [Rummeliibacillus stabekisii]|uniref:Uncharacterized protein n=1 Tax=Rummeliibacillus stabekisii TaxID=241244 RepID=A0A143HC35_9BACL|nr:hypothetical protein [Rummeliibacillus stabekisii]AMW99313.1 hypothetical protein ATY39_07440 [Rummeliibacillus stabekisii]
MIPLRLQKGIIKRLEKLFKKNQYQRPPKSDEIESDVHYSKLNFYEQNLPIKNAKDDSPYPLVLVKLMHGDKANSKADHIINIQIAVGVYNNLKSCDGHRDVAQILSSSIEHFEKNPIIEGMFELDLDSSINWELSDEDTFPFYFGAVSLNFKIPLEQFKNRTDVEGLI